MEVRTHAGRELIAAVYLPRPHLERTATDVVRIAARRPAVAHAMTQTQTATRYILIALALVALGLVLWKTSDVAIVTFGGIVIATAWRALAVPLAKRTGWGEKTAVLLVVGVVILLLAGAGWLFGAKASEQWVKFQDAIPHALQQLAAKLDSTSMGRTVAGGLRQVVTEGDLMSNVGLAAGALLAGALNVVLMLFLSVYLALSPRNYLEGFLRLLPPARRPQVREALEEAGAALQRWLLAQLIAMGLVGVAVGIGLALIGVPLALLLGLIAGLFEFIPVVGPVLFAIPGLLVAFSQDPQTVLLVFVLYVVVQTLESNVLIPLLQRWAVRLPPAISLIAALVGMSLFGPVGLVFASPLAVVVMGLVKHLYVEDTLESSAAVRHDARGRSRKGPAAG